MSQRRFVSKGFEVLTGWDRPLQYHFLTVEKPGDDYPVYCNLDDPERPMGVMLAIQVCDKLRELGIPAPPTLLEDLLEDRNLDRGNYIVDYGVVA